MPFRYFNIFGHTVFFSITKLEFTLKKITLYKIGFDSIYKILEKLKPIYKNILYINKLP